MNSAPGAPVAIVTGAGSGIAARPQRLLARAGYRVALVGRERSEAQTDRDHH